jgi:hypothetical protein
MNEKQHTLEVPGVGAFVFRRRVMADTFKVSAEYSRLTEGVPNPSTWLDLFATAYATIKVLAAEVPAGWDMAAMDPEDDESYKQIMGVFGALRAAEARFRLGHGTESKGSGAGNGGHGDAVVPAALHPPAQ